MKIAWFIHRYFPCVGGAENYGRAMVRRFVEAGHEVDVLTSDAHDLWYFTNKGRKRVEAPPESIVDGARVRRFAGQACPAPALFRPAPELRPALADPMRRRVVHADPPRDRATSEEITTPSSPLASRTRSSRTPRYLTARAAGAPLLMTPFLHLATPGDQVNKTYTRPHQIRLLSRVRHRRRPDRPRSPAPSATGASPTAGS